MSRVSFHQEKCHRCSRRRGLVSKRMLYALFLIQVANFIVVTTLDPNLSYRRFNLAHYHPTQPVANINFTVLSRHRTRLPYFGLQLESTRRQLILSQPSARYFSRLKTSKSLPVVVYQQSPNKWPNHNLTTNKSAQSSAVQQRTAPDSKCYRQCSATVLFQRQHTLNLLHSFRRLLLQSPRECGSISTPYAHR